MGAPASHHDISGFYEILQRRERGKLKVYMGSAAGTGKTYRMLQEAHELRHRGVDVVVGYVETHGRPDTQAQLGDLEVIPRRTIPYKHVLLEEMDLRAILARRPHVALVDELAHSNVPGSPHNKRWEDVLALLDAGINVISAVNVQHLESLSPIIQRTLGVTVRETVPDWVILSADLVINLDISSEELRQRLRDGKIYAPDKIESALQNFFTNENLTTLRELALREVASSVDRAREEIVRREDGASSDRSGIERILVALSSNPMYAAQLIHRATRIAGRLNSDWLCVHVDQHGERASKTDVRRETALAESLRVAQHAGARVVRAQGAHRLATIVALAREHEITLVIVGQAPRRAWPQSLQRSLARRLVDARAGFEVLVVPLLSPADTAAPMRRRGADLRSITAITTP